MCLEAVAEADADERREMEAREAEEELRKEERELEQLLASLTVETILPMAERLVENVGLDQHIIFSSRCWLMTDEQILEELDGLLEGCVGFYIGATQDPVRRWEGDKGPVVGRKIEEGHSKTWLMKGVIKSIDELQMVILTVRKGKGGAELEEKLIDAHHGRLRPRCFNISKAASGLSKKAEVWNFLYVLLW